MNDKKLSGQFATTTDNFGGSDATPRTSNDSGFSSRQPHQSILDGMTEGYVLLDGAFRITDINREAMRLDDRPREALIGRTHWDAYPGSETSELGQLYQKAMRERIPVALEHRYEWGEGRATWLAMRAYPTDDGGLAIFYRDVSERHAQDQRLIESEARFRAALDATQDILWTNDAAGKMVGSQPGWEKLTGQTQEQYQGHGWSNAVHPDDAQPTIVAWEAAVADKRPFVFEHRVRRHDGVWRRCAIRAVPIVDAENNIREWVGVHTDITDSRGTQTRFRQLAETITEVFYVLEVAAGRISYVSPAYERVWRRSAEQLYNGPMAYFAAIHPDDRHQAEKALERQQKGLNSDVRYRLLHDDGTVTYIHDRAFVTSDPDTGSPRVVGLAEDVTTSTKARQL